MYGRYTKIQSENRAYSTIFRSVFDLKCKMYQKWSFWSKLVGKSKKVSHL